MFVWLIKDRAEGRKHSYRAASHFYFMTLHVAQRTRKSFASLRVRRDFDLLDYLL